MNLSEKIISFVKITRPLNVILTFFVVVVAVFITRGKEVDPITIFISALSAALVTAAGNIINDIYDIGTDSVSHPERILVKGLLNKKEAIIFYILLNISAVIFVSTIYFSLLLIVVITIMLLFIYSAFLKKLPLIGNFIIAFLTGLAFIYGGIVTKNAAAAVLPAMFAFLINFIREIVKDIQDIEGDKKTNLSTFPIHYGIKKSKFVILILTITLVVFTVYPFFVNVYNIEYFVIIMVIVNPVLILCLRLLFSTNRIRLALISNLLKLDMIFGLIAIFLGK